MHGKGSHFNSSQVHFVHLPLILTCLLLKDPRNQLESSKNLHFFFLDFLCLFANILSKFQNRLYKTF